MKRTVLVLAAAAAAIVVLGLAGFYIAYEVAHLNEPAVVTRNLRQMTIPRVEIETNRGESHTLTNLASQQSRRVKLSGQEKLVWIVATLADGKELVSEKMYMSSEGVLVASIAERTIYWDLKHEN